MSYGASGSPKKTKSLNDAVIPVLHIRGISCNFPPYLNKMYLFVRSYRVRLLADEEMKFAYRYQQGLLNTHNSSSMCSGFSSLYPC